MGFTERRVVTLVEIGTRVIVRHGGFGEVGMVSGFTPNATRFGEKEIQYWDVTLDLRRQDGRKRLCRRRTIDLKLVV